MRFLLPIMVTLVSGQAMARPLVLVVTATAGYRHESIETAEQVIEEIAAKQNIDVSFVRTEEEVRLRLTDSGLQKTVAVFFVNTTGELPATAATAIVAWVGQGGTFVGIHSASDTWHGVPEYIEMLGGEFAGHPPETHANVIVDDSAHPATQALPPSHVLFEEFYYLGKVDLSRVRPLLSLRARPEPGEEPGYYPLAWEKPFGRGRVLYSALGHREAVWLSEWFRAHMAGIVEWAVSQPSTLEKRRAVRH
jgi:type 1 glutamine amidotransferase